MNREDRIKLAIEKGCTYDEVTGKVYGVRGNEIKTKSNGYIVLKVSLDKKYYSLRAHQFAYYYKYGKIVEQIDHKDGDRTNNKISNLREVTHQQNQHNRTKAKGYYYDKVNNKFMAYIGLNNKQKTIGRFNTEQEARQAYLDAKKIYHII